MLFFSGNKINKYLFSDILKMHWMNIKTIFKKQYEQIKI